MIFSILQTLYTLSFSRDASVRPELVEGHIAIHVPFDKLGTNGESPGFIMCPALRVALTSKGRLHIDMQQGREQGTSGMMSLNDIN